MPIPSRSRITRALAALAAGLCLSTGAAADAWPSKTIKIIIPFAAGGVTDVVIRTISPKLSEALGQPVVIENKGGAGGTLGTAMGAAAAPDGYTFIAPAASHTTTPSLYSKLSFDPVKDFAAVTQIVTVPYLLVVPASSPMQTLADFIAAAKAKPGTLTFGSAGNGSSNHLAGELLAGSIGAPLVHVPYKGSAPAKAATIAGEVSMTFEPAFTGAPLIKGGQLKAVAVMGSKRSDALPDVPTVAEVGYPGMEMQAWVGFVAPAGVPQPVLARLAEEIKKIMAAPEVQKQLVSSGAEPVGYYLGDFAAYLRDESAKYKAVIEEARIKAE